MNDINSLKHAKEYIDKMANGVNPLTDQPAAEYDVINNIKVARCLFYVSDVLRQLIEDCVDTLPEEKSSKTGKKGYKKDFWLSANALSAFPFSDTPIPISEIHKRLNELKTDPKMKQLRREVLTDWLIDAGFLELITTAEGKQSKRPTKQGEALGITVDSRDGMYGPYYVILYNRDAQQFIIDNIDSILSAASK